MKQKRNAYDVYGEMAKEIEDNTLLAGRATIQKHAESLIIHDILSKLDIDKNDEVLEIGCGAGALLMPLSLTVKNIYGIDHPEIISRLKNRIDRTENINLLGGNWLYDSFDLILFSKVLIYSVIHYTETIEETISFIEKTLECVQEGGKILLGDIPNEDKRERFNSSAFGMHFNESWSKQRQKLKTDEEIKRDELFKTADSNSLVKLNDKSIFYILNYFRELGHEAYLLPQPTYLPFGYTREDILIIKR